MSRTNAVERALLLLPSLFAMILPATAHAKTVTVESGRFWTVTDSSGTDLGPAQNVCRFAAAPEGCPPGATLFGAPQWTPLPSANWIWTPGTTETSSADAEEEFTFKMPFFLCGAPLNGSLSVAADNSAEVSINGTVILTTQDFSSVTSLAVPASNLLQGLNFIEAKVENAASDPACPDQYQCNPAGLIVKLTATDNLDPWPTCTDSGRTFQVGDFLDQPCPAGQMGSNSKVCICAGNFATWLNASNTCRVPDPAPVTCTGANGASFAVNATEAVSCPARMVGTAFRTCQSDGQWSAADSSGCSLPTAAVGGMCRDNFKVEIAICPAGTTCGSRRIPPPPRPWWCILALWIPNECHPIALQTADWFCD